MPKPCRRNALRTHGGHAARTTTAIKAQRRSKPDPWPRQMHMPPTLMVAGGSRPCTERTCIVAAPKTPRVSSSGAFSPEP
eukprot:356592-Chlamydomonas_euryale.AAC.4